MGRPPLSFDIAPKHQRELAELLSGGVQQVRVVLRALALLQLAKGASAPQIANVVPLTAEAIRSIGRRYQQGGLERALYEKQRPGAAEVLDDSQKQRLIAMVCADPPEGRARWTVRLVAEYPLSEAFQRAEEIWRPVYLSADAQEGPAAFRDHRPPRWQGR